MAIQIAALAILAAFYGVYLGKMLAQRRRGIRTDQMARGNKRGRLFWTELLLKGVTCAVALAEAACALADWNSAPTWLRWLGLGLAAAGVGVFAASVYTMRDSWRAGIPREGETELVTAGIYRFSRNPAFLGFDLTYLGLLLPFGIPSSPSPAWRRCFCTCRSCRKRPFSPPPLAQPTPATAAGSAATWAGGGRAREKKRSPFHSCERGSVWVGERYGPWRSAATAAFFGMSRCREEFFEKGVRSVYKELHADHETGLLTTNKG